VPPPALNFGLESHLNHDQRYDRADEFMELIHKLWDSWERDALILDRQASRSTAKSNSDADRWCDEAQASMATRHGGSF
jgi:alkanesulfonate monooxygenase SsuD/methylene tetrahydromethanopterin reductase-like flavin-dependent oxidoreductase (luciferase family)